MLNELNTDAVPWNHRAASMMIATLLLISAAWTGGFLIAIDAAIETAGVGMLIAGFSVGLTSLCLSVIAAMMYVTKLRQASATELATRATEEVQ